MVIVTASDGPPSRMRWWPMRLAALISSCLASAHRAGAAAAAARNILMIVVDDLRPQIKAYGVPWMVTPHIDRLAAQGMLFERAYVQQAICSPTRNSFLSGRYPDKTRTWNFIDDFRSGSPEGGSWTALPEFFRKQGFFTTGAGKVYHPNHPPNDDQNRSWSERYQRSPPGAVPSACSCGGSGWPPHGQVRQ
eukprot:SAG31_NODE_7281_length_1734_cov_2.241590_2_plen_192_part_00